MLTFVPSMIWWLHGRTAQTQVSFIGVQWVSLMINLDDIPATQNLEQREQAVDTDGHFCPEATPLSIGWFRIAGKINLYND